MWTMKRGRRTLQMRAAEMRRGIPFNNSLCLSQLIKHIISLPQFAPYTGFLYSNTQFFPDIIFTVLPYNQNITIMLIPMLLLQVTLVTPRKGCGSSLWHCPWSNQQAPGSVNLFWFLQVTLCFFTSLFLRHSDAECDSLMWHIQVKKTN